MWVNATGNDARRRIKSLRSDQDIWTKIFLPNSINHTWANWASFSWSALSITKPQQIPEQVRMNGAPNGAEHTAD